MKYESMSDPQTTGDWSRDKVVKLLKNYADGADFSELLIRKTCKEAFMLLHRQRGVENAHFSPKAESND
jgi:hypothetical protein